MRAWLAMFSGVALVLFVGLSLLVIHSSARKQRLGELYDRAVARSASQVGLRWEGIVKRLAAPAAESDQNRFTTAFEGDGTLVMGQCEAEAAGKDAYVSADGLALVKRHDAKRCGKVLFSTLLNGPRAGFAGNRGRARHFDQVLLIDGAGRVLAEERQVPQLTFAVLPRSPQQLVSAPAAAARLTLGATEYRAFVRPVRLFAARADRLLPLYVCGLVRERALVDDSLQVESLYALLGLFLFAMALVALPAAKLWLIGPQVRYRRRDVQLFRVATVIGSVLSLVLVLGVAARESLRARLDVKLQTIAQTLGQKFAQRVERSANALQAFAQADGFAKWPRARDPKLACEPVQAEANVELAPRWNVVFRLDSHGLQTAKYYRKTVTPCVPVPEREYFKAVRRGHLRDLRQLSATPREPKLPSLRGAADVVRSRTTGKLALVVAMPEPARPGNTIALETSLDDLAMQLLPRGVQTAVIDARGRVLVHSDNDTFQEQGFFEDVARSDQPALRAALEAKVQRPISLEYLGDSSRVYLQPLQGGWTALSVAPVALLDLPTRQIVLLTLLLCLAALSCPLALALLARVRRTRAHDRPTVAMPAAQPDSTPPGRLSSFALGASPLDLQLALARLEPASSIDAPGGLAASAVDVQMMAPLSNAARGGDSEAANGANPARKESAATAADGWLSRALRDGMRQARSMPHICGAVLLTTALLFYLSFQGVAEDCVSTGLLHAALQRQRYPDCFTGKGECVGISALSVQRPTTSGVPPSSVDQVVASLLDVILPLTAFESDSVSLPPRASAPFAVPWTFRRVGDKLLVSSAELDFELREAVPSLFAGIAGDIRSAIFLFAFVIALSLASFALWASYRRLSFARTKLGARDDISLHQLTAWLQRPKERRLLVLHPQPALLDGLRKSSIVEIEAGDPPSRAAAFIAHAERFFLDPVPLAKTIEAYPGKLIVLSTVDWTRWLPPERRALLDYAFRDFQLAVGPGIGRWPEPPTQRRALASALWSSCNEDERRLLAQLALDGYAAPHPINEPLVVHLRARGILHRERVAFAEPHFRTYVRHTVDASELRNAESTQQHDAWNAIRAPLSTAALLVLCVVTYMQPELAALGLPISSALVAVRPVLRMLGLPSDS